MAKTGRPRTFNEAEVINKAMMLFWEKGYEGVSLSDLEEATGLKRVSLYNAIGDKEVIFLKVLEVYMEMVRGILSQMIIEADLEGLKMFFQGMAQDQPMESPSHWGCLMVNTVLDVKQFSEKVKAKVSDYRQMLIDAFKQNLQNSVDQKLILATPEEIDSRANYLLSVLWGNLTTIRLFGNNEAIKPGIDALISTIDSWKKD